MNFSILEKVFLYKWVILCALFCSLFLGNAFVLSNYGYILEFLGVPNSHPFIGTPKLIPGLDLEAYIYTPQFQILVNNDFQRFNHTSLFKEDLKSLYSLPIRDWGLIFKPNMWAFFVIPPAYALSLFHLFSLCLFLLGYFRLAKLLGAKSFYACIFSVGLFFTGFVQVWWMLFGASLALFPWIILLLVSHIKNEIKFFLLYYILTCWLITNFYPPLVIILGFVGFLIFTVIEPDFYRRKSILLWALAAILAAGTAVFYLLDPILAIKNSIYPGDRVASGGSDFPAVLWLNQIFPSLLQNGTDSLISVQMAEAAAITSYFLLVILFFKDFQSWFAESNVRTRKSIAVLLSGLALIWVWMLLPLPSWVGKIFLWDHVQPRRMVAGSGILIFAITCCLVNRFPWKLTWLRCFGFSLAVLLPWLAYKFQATTGSRSNIVDLIPVCVCVFIPLAARLKLSVSYMVGFLLIAALLVNLAVFGRYNPVQSAKPFFSKLSTESLTAIHTIADNSSGGVVALERFEGAVLNGLGFKSAGHALLTPQPQVYRRFFPVMDEEKFNQVFNRTASIRVFYNIEPNSGGLGVNVPIDSFGANLEIRKLSLSADINSLPIIKEKGGEISSVVIKDQKVIINGWARWSGINKDQTLYLYSLSKIDHPLLRYSVNGRGGEHILSSFYLSFDLPEAWSDASPVLPICLVSYDQKFGTHLLENAKGDLNCDELLPK